MKRIGILFIFFLYGSSCLVGQEHRNSWGLIMEIGASLEKLPEGFNYRPFLIGVSFERNFYDFDEIRNLTLEIIPIFGMVINSHIEYEFGINGRLAFYQKISDTWNIGVKIGSGPYWITIDTKRQAKGFIFSDYFILSARKLSSRRKYEAYIAYRHMSNLEIKFPNSGINNIMAGIGIYF